MTGHSTPTETRTVYTTESDERYDGACEAVVFAVATAANRDPASLTPLYEAVDPDALDRLFLPGRDGVDRRCRVTFSYAGREVTVDGTTGERVHVSVEPSGDQTATSGIVDGA